MITSWDSDTLAQITSGTWHSGGAACPVAQIEIDHRHLIGTSPAPSGLFVALAGTSHDGHDFVPELDASHCALVAKADACAAAAQLQVADPLTALHELAKAAMQETTAPKIAITGSVGKTSTKQALHDILAQFDACHASQGNYNNHIGAPLSMARTPDEARYIIMEMGMNHQGEISPLSHLYDGDIAVITKIADSHIGHFENTKQIAYAKAEIFDGMTSGIALLPADDTHFPLLRDAAIAQGLEVISFGKAATADITLCDQIPLSDGQKIIWQNGPNGQSHELICGLSAPHHATTILIILAVLHQLGLPWQKARDAFASLREVKGRGNHQRISAKGHDCLLIDDSYNASPASLSAALHYIASLSHPDKTLILTDMLELGAQSAAAHHALIPLIEAIAPAQLWLIGPEMSKLAPHMTSASVVHPLATAQEAIGKAAEMIAGSDLLFIKGSNGSGAPQIAAHIMALSEMVERTENVT